MGHVVKQVVDDSHRYAGFQFQRQGGVRLAAVFEAVAYLTCQYYAEHQAVAVAYVLGLSAEGIVLKVLAGVAQLGTEKAYCPYTETPVGACVLTQNGMLFCGCNIENVALSGSFGAMEVAVCKAISEGANNIMAVAMYCEKGMVFPSGSERQLLREFGSRTTIICATVDKQEEFTIQELLPFAKENACEN